MSIDVDQNWPKSTKSWHRSSQVWSKPALFVRHRSKIGRQRSNLDKFGLRTSDWNLPSRVDANRTWSKLVHLHVGRSPPILVVLGPNFVKFAPIWPSPSNGQRSAMWTALTRLKSAMTASPWIQPLRAHSDPGLHTLCHVHLVGSGGAHALIASPVPHMPAVDWGSKRLAVVEAHHAHGCHLGREAWRSERTNVN